MMKTLLTLLFILSSSSLWAYDSAACHAFARQQNKLMPKAKSGFTSVMTHVECLDSSGAYVMTMRAKGHGSLSFAQAQSLILKQTEHLKPAMCRAMKDGYPFADALIIMNENEEGQYLFTLSWYRKDCE